MTELTTHYRTHLDAVANASDDDDRLSATLRLVMLAPIGDPCVEWFVRHEDGVEWLWVHALLAAEKDDQPDVFYRNGRYAYWLRRMHDVVVAEGKVPADAEVWQNWHDVESRLIGVA